MAKILLIDDDDLVLQTLAAALQIARHSVVCCTNGQQGIRHLESEYPDIVITDIFMPELDGLELIRTLRRSHPELPIIAISGRGGFGPIDYLRAAEAFGATEILRKPFRPAELTALIFRVLTRSIVQ